MHFALALSLVGAAAAASACTFCALNEQGRPVSFDLSTLPTQTWSGTGAAGDYTMASPCLQSNGPQCGPQADPMTQSCKGLGSLANFSIGLVEGGGAGFNLTLHGGFDDPPMPQGRNAVYHFICDTTVPSSNPPEFGNLTEAPGGFYNLVWSVRDPGLGNREEDALHPPQLTRPNPPFSPPAALRQAPPRRVRRGAGPLRPAAARAPAAAAARALLPRRPHLPSHVDAHLGNAQQHCFVHVQQFGHAQCGGCQPVWRGGVRLCVLWVTLRARREAQSNLSHFSCPPTPPPPRVKRQGTVGQCPPHDL